LLRGGVDDEPSRNGHNVENPVLLDSPDEEQQLDSSVEAGSDGLVTHEVMARIRAEIRDEIKAEIEEQIKARTVARLEEEILTRIETGINSEAMAELKREVHTEIMHEVDDEINSKVMAKSQEFTLELRNQSRRARDDAIERSKRYLDTKLEQANNDWAGSTHAEKVDAELVHLREDMKKFGVQMDALYALLAARR
jgi:hypothetical protein